MASPMALIMSCYLLCCALDIRIQGVSIPEDKGPILTLVYRLVGISLKPRKKSAVDVSPVVCAIFTAASSNGR
jgi:hypothetical protein